MHKCVSICLHEEADHVYIVAERHKCHHQPMLLMFSRVISLLGCAPEPTCFATQVRVLIFVILRQDCPPPLQTEINSQDYLLMIITNV